jgi:hypothetical protein
MTTFGVELECYLPASVSRHMAAQAITAAGVPCVEQSYGHAVPTTWKVVTDGSLNDRTTGSEFVSPILTGDEGMRQTKIVCDTLTALGATVNRSTGLHVHIGVRGQPISFFRRLFALYAHYEDVIDSVMPVSRRGNENRYIRSLKGKDYRSATTVEGIARIFERAAGQLSARYHKLNIMAYARQGTVEFRQHSGTVDAKKVLHWITFCQQMVAYAAKPEAAPTVNIKRRHIDPVGTRKAMELLMRPDGASQREVDHELGLTGVDIPWRCRSAQVAYVRRNGRYYVNAGTDATAKPATFDNLMDELQADAMIKTFYAGRRIDVGYVRDTHERVQA